MKKPKEASTQTEPVDIVDPLFGANGDGSPLSPEQQASSPQNQLQSLFAGAGGADAAIASKMKILAEIKSLNNEWLKYVNEEDDMLADLCILPKMTGVEENSLKQLKDYRNHTLRIQDKTEYSIVFTHVQDAIDK